MPEEGGPEPPIYLTEEERSGGVEPLGSTGPPEGFEGLHAEETGGGTENRPKAADEPPTNRAEEDAAKPLTKGRPTNEPPIDWVEEDAAKPETE